MRVYKKLYVSECLKGKEKKIIRRIRRRSAKLLDIYMIVLSNNPQEQLDIYNTGLLQQDLIDLNKCTIIGVGFGRAETMKLIKTIVLDTYQKTGTGNIRNYIQQEMERLC